MNKPSYGVIVGRFQVNDLHAGHMELFREVRARHNRIIVFVGVAPTEITRVNPLDFETRKAMIQAKFPEFTVLPIADVSNDELWSRVLDSRIQEIADYGDITLYGGRDSFVPHYKGHFKPVELTLHDSPSGTQIRDGITNTVLESSDFRAGIIHAAMNMRPRAFPTVDVAILRDLGNGGIQVLLAQKPGESCWRFVGGFAEPDSSSYECDAQREAFEETGVDINSLVYLGSAQVQDWRYADVPDKIKTIFYAGWASTGHAVANDDIETCRWFDVSTLWKKDFVDCHKILFLKLQKYLEKNYAVAFANQSPAAD